MTFVSGNLNGLKGHLSNQQAGFGHGYRRSHFRRICQADVEE